MSEVPLYPTPYTVNLKPCTLLPKTSTPKPEPEIPDLEPSTYTLKRES